ncbi:MAG: hypothetical protein ACD_76C00120G0002 [uncultured bacterium]|nr:MAG: hypothetical protein ACD_76C00120G0002 [uncultured bacterium]HBD04862.1 hypothetical protein [Candidatus Uhrbacteria bacterium]
MKKMVIFLIGVLAHGFIKAHKPKIVAVTGSVGKTSAKFAMQAVLASKFKVRSSFANYNNEVGVPLTIFGSKSAGDSVFGWAKILVLAFLHLIFKRKSEYPDLLVLEYGADRPGDIAKLCSIARPDVSVITAVSTVHAERFASIDEIALEKAELIKCLKPDGLAVLNIDDQLVARMHPLTSAKVQTYGFKDGSDFQAKDYSLEALPQTDGSFDVKDEFSKINFTVIHKDSDYAVEIANAIGQHNCSAALAAIAVGMHFGISVEQSIQSLRAHYYPPNGRMRPIGGVKGSLIIDDTYNAAPMAMLAALDTLAELTPASERQRIAVLGSMAELGKYTVDEHRKAGAKAAELGIDKLICVGEEARDICRGAIDAGMDKNKTIEFSNSVEAGRYLDSDVEKGDIVLVKGSQRMRMEKTVKDIMAEPLRAGELLVRQYGKWLET